MPQKVESPSLDPESDLALHLMMNYRKIRSRAVSGVRVVLVVLSAAGMAYDIEALRQKILLSYPDAAVFFQTTAGDAVGSRAPRFVDLLIDFTGPKQRQGFFHARCLRKRARVAVGRKVGFWRKKMYDRIYDETVGPTSGDPLEVTIGFSTESQTNQDSGLFTSDLFNRERFVQRAVLALAGVPIVQAGVVLPDLGKSIALELPGLTKG